jgi:hypothetical protein
MTNPFTPVTGRRSVFKYVAGVTEVLGLIEGRLNGNHDVRSFPGSTVADAPYIIVPEGRSRLRSRRHLPIASARELSLTQYDVGRTYTRREGAIIYPHLS